MKEKKKKLWETYENYGDEKIGTFPGRNSNLSELRHIDPRFFKASYFVQSDLKPWHCALVHYNQLVQTNGKEKEK